MTAVLNEPLVYPQSRTGHLFFGDAMRTLGSFFVVLIHSIYFSGLGSRGSPLLMAHYASSMWAVPCFFMLSGAIFIGDRSRLSRPFLKKRLLRFAFLCLFWNVFYIAWDRLFWQTPVTAGRIKVLFTLGVATGHLWFMPVLLGLYVVTPIITLITDHLSTRHCQAISLSILAFACIDSAVQFYDVQPESVSTMFFRFIPFVGYYFTGWTLVRTGPLVSWRTSLLLVIFSVAVTAIGGTFTTLEHGEDRFLLRYFSPTRVIMSLAVFQLLLSTPSFHSRIFASIAPLSLGIYLIHKCIMDVFHAAFPGTAYTRCYSIALATFFLSAAITLAFKQLPFLRRLV